VRGLAAAKFNAEEEVVAYAGVSSYVCPERATDDWADQTLGILSPLPDNIDDSQANILSSCS
jgi:hypothetical protein